MENKINLARLLKDCPKGMEFDCTMYDNVKLDYVLEGNLYPIKIQTPEGQISLNKYGCYSNNKHAKCVIFPKGRTTWEGFVPPCKFKDGDVVFYDNSVSIFKEWGDETLFRNYVKVDIDGKYPTLCIETSRFGKGIKREARFATEEEKQKLFQAIKDKGYRWNAKTKTLEKLVEPKFKVGDKIVHKVNKTSPFIITEITNTSYKGGNRYEVLIEQQDNFELLPNKFDITTLKPFDKVLVRSSSAREWTATLYSHYNNNKFYGCGMYCDQCIPYEHNEHLCGTTDDCNEYYKTWE